MELKHIPYRVSIYSIQDIDHNNIWPLRFLPGKVCAYLPGSARLAVAKCAVCCWVFSDPDIACISLWRHNFNPVALPHFRNPSMKLWEVFQKLGKISWIRVYAARKRRFWEVQTYPELLQLYDITHDKTHVYAFGDRLQLIKKLFLLTL